MDKRELFDLLKNDNRYRTIKKENNLYDYELLSLYYSVINDQNVSMPWDILFSARKDYLENVSFLKLLKDKILLISDSHLGCKEENIDYFYMLNEFIKKNEIRMMINGGDIGDGMIDYSKKYSTVDNQIEHIIEMYNIFDIKQYILAGNHDAHYKRKAKDILKILMENNSDITGIGYYQSYFNIYDKIISVDHKSRMKNNILIEKDFSISGHAHVLKFKTNSIKLPTISDNFPDLSQNGKPGFVLLKTDKVKNEVALDFSSYIFFDNNIKKDKQKTYYL